MCFFRSYRTAFKNLPAWGNFVEGKKSDMLRMRRAFTDRLEALHRKTMAEYAGVETAEEEASAFRQWQAVRASRPSSGQPRQEQRHSCPACEASLA